MAPDDTLFAIDFGDGTAWVFDNDEFAKCDLRPVALDRRRVEKVAAGEMLVWLTSGKQRITRVTVIPSIPDFRTERSFEEFESWLDSKLSSDDP